MTNFTDRFGGAGRLFNPKPSQTFRDPGTLAFNTGTGGKLEGSGQRAPVIDNPYQHLNLPVRLIDGSGANRTMVRGRNMGGSVWSIDFSSPPANAGGQFRQAYHYDQVNNNLYWLSNNAATAAITRIEKVDVVTGTWTNLMVIPSITYNANTFGHIIFPITPATPDTSNWVVIRPEENSPFRMIKTEYNSAGALQNTQFFKVDIGGPDEDEVNFQGGYITAANDLMISPMYAVSAPTNLASGFMSFSLLRGASRIQVVLPVDGIAPLPETALDISAAGITPDFEVMMTAWGDSVIALVDGQTGSAAILRSFFGTRIWDRDSFDAELQKIADIYSAAPAEVFFT